MSILFAAICRYPWSSFVSHSLLTRPSIGLKTLACDNHLRQLVNDCSFLSVLAVFVLANIDVQRKKTS
ncbi:hypothetical protein KC340_g154 [Hortaea werneckii]|nr:hypothetical protein KC340_g154 [Hortaea werneckii]